MIERDVIIVGGGPAGSTCAWRLKDAGYDPLILDKEDFPRPKLCAGWVTKKAARQLHISAANYPHSFLTYPGIQAHVKGLKVKLPGKQHSIRRYEFDDYLLKRCGAEVQRHTVKTIVKDGEHFILDDQYRCRYLIGAGGTRCPVYRALFREANPRAKILQTATLEHEFPYQWDNGECHLWFFDKGLPGYSWYVPKANGYLNVGIGGMAAGLAASKYNIHDHWTFFTEKLARQGFVTYDYQPKGFSYYLRGGVECVRIGNAFITGDSAGLATKDLCEGIGPAIESGFKAADAISKGQPYQLEDVTSRSIKYNFISKLIEYGMMRGLR